MQDRPQVCDGADAKLVSNESASPDPRPIELDIALAQLDGDRETLNEAISIFVETIPAMVADIQTAYRQASAEQLQTAAHSLKGAAATICAEPVRQAAQLLEQMGGDRQLDDVGPVLSQLENDLHILREFARTLD